MNCKLRNSHLLSLIFTGKPLELMEGLWKEQYLKERKTQKGLRKERLKIKQFSEVQLGEWANLSNSGALKNYKRVT